MRKFFKYLSIALLSAVFLGGALALHTWYAKPLFIDWFYTRTFFKLLLEEPEWLTSMRILEPFGIRGHNAKLGDSSTAADDQRMAQGLETLATFKKYSSADLKGQAAISHAVFEYAVTQRVDDAKWRWHHHPITQLQGAHTWLPSLMTQQQQINDATDAEHYIARLGEFPRKMQQIAEQIEARKTRGIVPPKFAVDKALAQIDGLVAQSGEISPLYKSFVEKIDKADTLKGDAARRDALKARARAAIDASVIPAYQALQKTFRALQLAATRNDGAWSLPDGAAFYQSAIKSHTTTEMSADTLHDLGLKDVARIGAEMDALLAKIDPASGTRVEKIKRIIDDPKRRYPDTDAGREAVLKDYQTIIDEISAGIDSVFRMKPKVGVVVKRVPTFSEKGSAAAYYEAPPLDGSAPGVFYANLFDVNATPRHAMRTLAYHEATPGHHFQIVIAQHVEGLPLFRSQLGFTAYDEGWALYAERLAWELGFQKDPYDNLGRLQDEMLRAVRLVVDTGIHAKRWNREQAIAYMVNETGMVETEVVSEIERYFVDPGQALAYKVGMFKILELRERAKSKLGGKFDLRDFHDVVLGNGSMPLTVLERVVDEYIASKHKS
jgi:uncharacterized protein (DUF885 family)